MLVQQSGKLPALMKLLPKASRYVCAQLWPSEQGIQGDSLDVSIPAEGQTLYFQLQEAELNIKLALLPDPDIKEGIPHS